MFRTSDPKYEQRRKESTSSYGSSTLSRFDYFLKEFTRRNCYSFTNHSFECEVKHIFHWILNWKIKDTFQAGSASQSIGMGNGSADSSRGRIEENEGEGTLISGPKHREVPKMKSSAQEYLRNAHFANIFDNCLKCLIWQQQHIRDSTPSSQRSSDSSSYKTMSSGKSNGQSGEQVQPLIRSILYKLLTLLQKNESEKR